jgi:hypothetical protein
VRSSFAGTFAVKSGVAAHTPGTVREHGACERMDRKGSCGRYVSETPKLWPLDDAVAGDRDEDAEAEDSGDGEAGVAASVSHGDGSRVAASVDEDG